MNFPFKHSGFLVSVHRAASAPPVNSFPEAVDPLVHSGPMADMIHLIGPGGAGKTTTGMALAARLGLSFVDLDAQFTASNGNISDYIDQHGYRAYAEQNVALYSTLVTKFHSFSVLALSSGFMTYPDDVHPNYIDWRMQVASSESTFVMLPSIDEETCVKEIVCRQLRRPFARTLEREEQVIRERFSVYIKLPAKKIETMKSIDVIVADIVRVISL